MRAALGSLDKVKRIVKVLGMVNAVPEFEDHPKVINGCSDLFVQVFAERGRHARSAVGMGSLPMGIPVEIECIVEVEEDNRGPTPKAFGNLRSSQMPSEAFLLLLLIAPCAGSVAAGMLPANARNAEAWLSGAVALAGLIIASSFYPQMAAGEAIRWSV